MRARLAAILDARPRGASAGAALDARRHGGVCGVGGAALRRGDRTHAGRARQSDARFAMGVARVRGDRPGASRGLGRAFARSAAELDPNPRVRAWARYALGLRPEAAPNSGARRGPLTTIRSGACDMRLMDWVKEDKKLSVTRYARRVRHRVRRSRAGRHHRVGDSARGGVLRPRAARDLALGRRRRVDEDEATTNGRPISPRESSPRACSRSTRSRSRPTTAMWDTSEYTAAAKALGIPHPPGNPLFVLIVITAFVKLLPIDADSCGAPQSLRGCSPAPLRPGLVPVGAQGSRPLRVAHAGPRRRDGRRGARRATASPCGTSRS